MFTTQEVASYYNTTQAHYEKWWRLKNSLSLHYGIWDETVNSFSESLVNTNRVMSDLIGISSEDKVLDAGCGVGGAAIYLATTKNTEVVGITLSEKQLTLAKSNAIDKGLTDKVTFQMMDYTQTPFEAESFDVVWACESVSSAIDKTQFIKEAFRVLKKGGKLILSDFFVRKDNQIDKNDWLRKWGETWGISQFVSSESFINNLTSQGFNNIKDHNYTDKIEKSAKRMYHAALLGALPSELYNLFHPNVSNFAKTHYKCGYYQYKALKAGLWDYKIITAFK